MELERIIIKKNRPQINNQEEGLAQSLNSERREIQIIRKGKNMNRALALTLLNLEEKGIDYNLVNSDISSSPSPKKYIVSGCTTADRFERLQKRLGAPLLVEPNPEPSPKKIIDYSKIIFDERPAYSKFSKSDMNHYKSTILKNVSYNPKVMKK